KEEENESKYCNSKEKVIWHTKRKIGREKPGERLLVKQNQNATWFTPNKGSVIPAKRRLVKRMMFDSIVQIITSLFCSYGGSSSGVSITKSKNYSSSSSKVAAQPNSSYGRKNAGM
ncbi:hypothetical protein I3760_16G020800, partial [Carya illinoinensis]